MIAKTDLHHHILNSECGPIREVAQSRSGKTPELLRNCKTKKEIYEMFPKNALQSNLLSSKNDKSILFFVSGIFQD